eukprot:11132464-Prorocentrum_lima.AAC.1
MVDKPLHESSLPAPKAGQLHCGRQLDHDICLSAYRAVFLNLWTEVFAGNLLTSLRKHSLASPSRVE